jgi:prefoldin subunit 5
MSLQRTENVRVVANDLEIYFRGFEVALKRKNVEDAVRYLESMIEEIDYTIEHLQPIRNEMTEMDNRKRDIEKTIWSHRLRIGQLEGELKKL